MLVYLLSKNSTCLRQIRQIVESIDLSLVGSCSMNALLTSCSRGKGCVLVPAMEFSVSEVKKLISRLRAAGFPHAVLVVDQLPTAEKAMEWARIPICDYFQLQTSPEALKTIFKNAKNWTQTQGMRDVMSAALSQRWRTLDDGMKDVMRLLYEGLTNRDIAERLSISSRTVESRRARLLETFDVDSFAELIRVATDFMDGDPLPERFFKVRS
ncbi:MAG: LuxR C-terminal-related transcriptional regulator [Thermoguttaceae bacterium]|nr:LuxR C-terminal-related transcriptional regulator [Thermoguttaceae bacterium]